MARIAHVLHVDDHDEDRQLFARAFNHSRVPAILHSLPSAAQALLFLNQYGRYELMPRPKLIVMDLSLPRLDGRELLDILRSTPRFAGIPVVVLTGSSAESDMQRCRAAGVFEYLVKPTLYEELGTLIGILEHLIVGSSNELPVNA
jgi:two-component system response regulator